MKIPKRKTLQDFQTSLAPSQEFRENLKSRLEAIYTIEHGQERSSFGFFRYASIFTSLILFMGMGYVLLDTNTQIEESSMQVSPPIKETKIISSPQAEKEISKDAEGSVGPVWSAVETPSLIQEKKVSSKVQEIQVRSSNEGKNTIKKDWGVFKEEAGVLDSSEIAPMASEAMFWADTNMIESQSYIPSFSESCEEYGGKLWDIPTECILENGKICTIENIDICGLSSSWAIYLWDGETDVFLQELIDGLGQ